MANNTLIGAIRAEATLESGKFVDGAKKIRQESQKTEAVVKQSFSGMGSAIKGFGGAVTAGLSIGLLTGLATKAIQYAQSIKTMAAQLGVTTKELQEFRYAAQQVGTTIPQADKGLEQLGVSIGKAAQGSKTTIAAFKAVGVEVEDLKTKSRTEIFGQIADQMIKQGGAAKNAAAGTALMGENFTKLVPLADKGSAGINGLAEAAQRLGVVLSDGQIQNADETARKLNDVKMVLAAQISGVVADNAASIVSLAQALGQLTSSIVNFLGSNPQAALGILGALAGARFGIPGAAAGGIAGLFAGGKLQSSRDASSGDVKYLSDRLRTENDKLKKYIGSNANGAGLNVGPQVKKVRELTKNLEAAVAARKNLSTAPPSIPLPEFLAGAPKSTRTRKAKTPRTPKAPRDRSDDVEFQFAQELRGSQMDVLRAQQSLAGSFEERSRLSLEMLDLEKVMRDAELEDRVRRAQRDFAEGKITEGALQEITVQADKLKLQYAETNRLEKQAVIQDRDLQRMERQEKLSQRSYEDQLASLQFEDEMADTQAEHRRIQLQIVDTLYKQKEAHLRALKAQLEFAGKIEEAADVQAEIDRLPTDRARDEGRAREGTKGPLEGYLDSLPGTTEKWNEALEQVQVRGLQSLEDGLMSIIDGTKSVGEAFRDMANQIIQDLIRIAIQKAIVAAIGGGFSGGGEVGAVGMATGGFVSGPGGPKSDSVPAMLSAGEFVINAAATKKFLPLLKGINEGGIKFAAGGLAIPRSSMGARVRMANDNENRRAGVTFDLRGAVMTEDLVRQMNEIGAKAADAGGNLGVQRMRDMNERTFGRALGR